MSDGHDPDDPLTAECNECGEVYPIDDEHAEDHTTDCSVRDLLREQGRVRDPRTMEEDR